MLCLYERYGTVVEHLHGQSDFLCRGCVFDFSPWRVMMEHHTKVMGAHNAYLRNNLNNIRYVKRHSLSFQYHTANYVIFWAHSTFGCVYLHRVCSQCSLYVHTYGLYVRRAASGMCGIILSVHGLIIFLSSTLCELDTLLGLLQHTLYDWNLFEQIFGVSAVGGCRKQSQRFKYQADGSTQQTENFSWERIAVVFLYLLETVECVRCLYIIAW